jgi:antitoxin component YwqK of YwqJK toxin-antitoxin module
MAFWDWFKKRVATSDEPIAIDDVPVKAERPAEGGNLRNGKKHGRWVERHEHEDTRWDAGKAVKLGTYGWQELTYADGVKQGRFVRRFSNGVAGRVGSYLDDKIDGRLLVRSSDGTLAGDGCFRADALHGHWVQYHDNGALRYESDYVDGKRDGVWREFYSSGKPKDEGTYERGIRCGLWRAWSAEGVLVEEGNYVEDKRHGDWQLRRSDGVVWAQGQFVAGEMQGPWRTIGVDGTLGQTHVATDETQLARWVELHCAIALVAAYEPTTAWVDHAKSTLNVMAQKWQVSETSLLGQPILSTPLDAAWQLRIAMGVPIHLCCRDELWARIVSALNALPAEAHEEAVVLVEREGLRYTPCMPRDWLTAILDNDSDDPRARIAVSAEASREFTMLRAQRFARRMPHTKTLILRECKFPDGFGVLFDNGYFALEQLLVMRSVADDIRQLYALIARATWVSQLQQLAIVESGGGPTDAELAALLRNPQLTSLASFTISDATLGAETARALREGGAGQHLETVELRECAFTVDAITALIASPSLKSLRLIDCQLPTMSARQAAAIDAPSLKTVKIINFSNLYEFDGLRRGAEWFARRIGNMPALGKLDELHLEMDLDEYAAQALLASPYLKTLKVLELTGDVEQRERDLLAAAIAGSGPPA